MPSENAVGVAPEVPTCFVDWRVGSDHLPCRSVLALASANPDLLLYGADFNNSSVNYVHAKEYWKRYRLGDSGELTPLGLGRYEIWT